MIKSETIQDMIIRDILSSKSFDFNGIVYHYTSPQGMLGIIQPEGKATLWFTRFDSLNDTYERLDIYNVLARYAAIRYRMKRISEEFRQLLCEIAEKKEKKLAFFSYIGKEISFQNTDGSVIKTNRYFGRSEEDTYICSFSRNSDSLPMWNYYSKSQHYEGYSIGVDCGRWCDKSQNNAELPLKFYSVVYSGGEKYQIFDDTLLKWDEIYQGAKSEDRESIREHIASMMSDMQYIFKDEHFQHEQEVRAVLHVPKDVEIPNSLEIRYRNSKGYIVPYVEYELPQGIIKSVTVAPLLEKELAKKNVQEMLKSRGYSCDVYSSEVPIRF